MTKGRLEAFSDGVLAIIITIMVLELKVPRGDKLAALLSDVPGVPRLRAQLCVRRHLLEQPSSPHAYGDARHRGHHVGQPAPVVLALALSRGDCLGCRPGPLRRALQTLVAAGVADGHALARTVANKCVEEYDRYLPEELLTAEYAGCQLDPRGAWNRLREVLAAPAWSARAAAEPADPAALADVTGRMRRCVAHPERPDKHR